MFSKGILAIIVAMAIIGCKNTNRNVRLFFNPSHAFNVEKIHFLAKVNDVIVVDTIFNNDHVDKSHFIKNVDFKFKNDDVFYLKINDKTKSVKGSDFGKNCLDIFTFYDDHTLINNNASEIEAKKNNKGLTADYKQIVDSLKKTSKINFYDEIKINIKPRNCEE